ncbi:MULTISPECIES: hypothetical protein [unclassified Paenibacillus]|uniref:hypothetical protein n=1 Tax=unclassified Paenibacillus TaxID=185978 RepID=UPI0030FD1D61
MTLDVFGSYRIVNNQIRANLQKLLVEGKTYQLKNPKRENVFYVVHPSAKEAGYIQATCFYKGVPWSDKLRLTMREIINELVYDGFTQLEKVVD